VGIEASSSARRAPHHARVRQPVTPWCGGRGKSRGALSSCWRVTPGNLVCQKVSRLRHAHRCARGRSRAQSVLPCEVLLASPEKRRDDGKLSSKAPLLRYAQRPRPGSAGQTTPTLIRPGKYPHGEAGNACSRNPSTRRCDRVLLTESGLLASFDTLLKISVALFMRGGDRQFMSY
jgi:hypothetical protein